MCDLEPFSEIRSHMMLPRRVFSYLASYAYTLRDAAYNYSFGLLKTMHATNLKPQ